MKIRVTVRKKPSVDDPAARVIAESLNELLVVGGRISSMTILKVFEIELDETDPAKAEETAKALASGILAHSVSETADYVVEP